MIKKAGTGEGGEVNVEGGSEKTDKREEGGYGRLLQSRSEGNREDYRGEKLAPLKGTKHHKRRVTKKVRKTEAVLERRWR